MYLIVGLGNPEMEYAKTRHNMGFDSINELGKIYHSEVTKKKFKGLFEKTVIEGKKVILLKPQTYMNLSGESIQECMHFFAIPPENMIVIYDDMDVEKGMIKIRKKGGAGSHNGMKSIIKELGTEDFPRIRVGIGKPEFAHDKINYVIGSVPEEEYTILSKGVKRAAKAVVSILTDGIDTAMNQYNERPEE